MRILFLDDSSILQFYMFYRWAKPIWRKSRENEFTDLFWAERFDLGILLKSCNNKNKGRVLILEHPVLCVVCFTPVKGA